MRDPAHPAIARMVEQFQMVMSLLDQQVRRMQTASFVVSDETETIEVTMNGHLRLTGLVIDPGILSLGAQDMAKWAQDNGYKLVIVVDKGRTDYTGFVETMKQKYGLDVEIDASRNLS